MSKKSKSVVQSKTIKLSEKIADTEKPKMTTNPSPIMPDETLPNAEYFDKLAQQCKRRSVRKYYEYEAELLRNVIEDRNFLKQFAENGENLYVKSGEQEKGEKQKLMCDQIITNVTLLLNVLLLIIKTIAAILSGSLAIVSSVIDSAVDLTSGVVIWFTNRAIRKRDPYLYPRGRTRLEPLAVIIVSVIMGVASIQMITKSLEAIIKDDILVNVDWVTISIMGFTILTKFVLYIVCCSFPSPSTNLLAQDHRNDCISNSVAIGCAFAADKWWKYLDPIGAIIVSVYICGTWCLTGHRHIIILSGRAAKPEFYSRIIHVAVDHDPVHIREIDTVQVYHLGTQFLVEVHVVFDKNMPVHQAHDISETLQRKIEHLPYVERSFVHVDYEATHRPDLEHKIV